ncbi:MAG TPA: amidohydrolase family protein [Tepidisphaeraceae bacterium]|nr:amidohydrolase family protein [Tepidisphaeraceae bacterium]
MSISILANHAHVFPESVNAGATIDRLLHLLDACGIAQAVCFAPFAIQMEQAEPNEWLARELAPRQQRLYGFGTIDLRRADVADQVRRARDLGFRGLKLHPNTQRFDILEPRALETYAAAEEAGLFITFHSGVHHYRLEHYRVTKFDEVAWRFPRLRMSLEHVGGYAFFNEAVAVIFNNIPFPPRPDRRPRVYGGLTSVFTPDWLRFWYMPPERLRELLLQVGPDLLIFGLDFPYNLERQTMIALRTLEEIIPDERDRALVLGGNLRRELGL